MEVSEMKRWLMGLFLLMLLAACGGSEGQGGDEPGSEAAPAIATDEETGLPLNPPLDAIPEGDFVVVGKITAVTLIPQDKPLFKVQSPEGVSYQIDAQPVSEIFVEDGTQLKAFQMQAGLPVRATLRRGQAGGIGSGLVFASDDLTILLDE
jgi:hypothetical protein